MSTGQSTLERANSFEELSGARQRATESAQFHRQIERHAGNLPSVLSDQGQHHVERLDAKLAETAQAIAAGLSDRIQALEQFSAAQSRTIAALRHSSRAAEQKLCGAVATIGRTFDDAISEDAHVEFSVSEEMPSRISAYCPSCTSTRIRRAYRQGVWDEILRLFFISPFRCRSCRHKFYRF